jgi:hypothetical protein
MRLSDFTYNITHSFADARYKSDRDNMLTPITYTRPATYAGIKWREVILLLPDVPDYPGCIYASHARAAQPGILSTAETS